MSPRKFIANNKKLSNECLASSIIDIDIDDESMDDDSNSQLKYIELIELGLDFCSFFLLVIHNLLQQMMKVEHIDDENKANLKLV